METSRGLLVACLRATGRSVHAINPMAVARYRERRSVLSLIVHHRKVKNQRLASVGYVWSFAALSGSRGARGHHDRRRSIGNRHTAALRNLFNRLLGQLHHCLITRQTYDENTTIPTPLPVPA